MKNRIGIAISVVSFLISCFLVSVGCQPHAIGYFTLDLGSAVMKPTFCLYRDPDFQQQLGIGGITVWKVPRSVEKKNQWEFNVLLPWRIGQVAWQSGWKVESLLEGWQAVWDLEYKASDTFMGRFLEGQSASPVCCLTYGEVPSNYQEKIKASPLEPEEFYSVWLRGSGGEVSKNMYFIIRLDTTGTPDRLEYLQENFLITPRYAREPRDSLKLYYGKTYK